MESATGSFGHFTNADHRFGCAGNMNLAPAKAQRKHGVTSIAAAVDQGADKIGSLAIPAGHGEQKARPKPGAGLGFGDKKDRLCDAFHHDSDMTDFCQVAHEDGGNVFL